jgi:hypothetical protein
MTNTTYTLGQRVNFTKNTGPLVVINHNDVRGIEIYARDEKAGEYVQVLETAPEIWVDGEAQSWSTGNFESIESARHHGSNAYRFINRQVGA